MATKRIKAAPVKSKAEATVLIDEIARLEVERQKCEAEMKVEVQQVQEKHKATLEVLEEQIALKMNAVEPFLLVHGEEMFEPKKREGETALARYGVRLGNPTVTKDKRYSWDDLCEVFRADAELKKFARVKVQPDKEAILKAWRESDPAWITAHARGLVDVAQADSVWIEPKAARAV